MVAGNDYWTGGWAQPNMNELPGTRAARNTGGVYGPLNALGDVLGALMERNAVEGALNSFGEYKSQMDAMSNTRQGEVKNPAAWVNDVAFTPEQAEQAKTLTGQNMLDGMTGNILNPRPLAGMQPETVPGEIPLTYQEKRKQLRDMVPKAAKELYAKYGAKGMQAVMPLLQAEIDDRLGAYGDTLLGQKRDAINNLTNGNVDMRDPRKLYQAIGDYNVLAHQMGAPMWDNSAYSEYVKMNTPNVQSVNLGGQIGYRGIYPNGDIAEIKNEQVTMTPAQQRADYWQGRNFAAGREDAERNFKIKEAGLKLDEARTAASIATAQAKIDRENGKLASDEMSAAELNAYSNMAKILKENFDNAMTVGDTDTAKKYATQYQEVTAVLDIATKNQLAKMQGRGQTSVGQEADAVKSGDVTVDRKQIVDFINKCREQNIPPEQIKQKLKEHGLEPSDWID